MLVCDSTEGRSCRNEASEAGDKSFFLLLFFSFLGATGREVQIVQWGGGKKGVALVLGEVIRHKGPRTTDRRNVSGPHVKLQTSS